MALFSRKPKTEDKKQSTTAPAPAQVTTSNKDLSYVLIHPRITEKATVMNDFSVYVFDIAPSANKRQVLEAVSQYYKVTPRMVRIVSIPSKSVRNMQTGKRGISHGGKKAYVYLKKGETITVF